MLEIKNAPWLDVRNRWAVS